MQLRRLVPFLLPMVIVVACALPTDERATPYDRSDLNPAIANTTTTSTTTTTLVPTTTLAPPGSSGTTIAMPTTTATPFASTSVDLYYTVGFSDELSKLRRLLPEDVSIALVIAELVSPVSDAPSSLRTSVRSGMVSGDVVVERGTALVSLDRDVVDDMSESNLRRAIAQLVLTLTRFRTTDGGNIGKVRFEIDRGGFEVFVPAFGGMSEPGEELAFEDFEPLIASTAAATTTTTTPDTTTTTSPTATEPPSTGG